MNHRKHIFIVAKIYKHIEKAYRLQKKYELQKKTWIAEKTYGLQKNI